MRTASVFQDKNVQVVKDVRDSIPDKSIRYAVLLHLNDGKRILVDEVGESLKPRWV